MKENNDNKRKPSILFLRHDFKLWQAIIITFFAMSVLICFVYFLNIPNPNMILIAGLVICSASFGFSGGIPAAVIMLGYTLYFFSAGQNGGQFMVFAGNNLAKVFVSVFGIAVDMVFVCILKKNESTEYRKVEELSEHLRMENEMLVAQSRIDALTGIGNRLSLRDRFDSYTKRNIAVMMIDIDDFKSINDTYGHTKGDEALKKTGELLSGIFGADNCYRYGGDEFLVIVPDVNESQCSEKLAALYNGSPEIDTGGKIIRVEYSVGCESGFAGDVVEFRKMLNKADENMYEVKIQKKADR